MSKSYYGLSTATADVSNANNLTATGGGSSTTQTTGTQTFNYGGYMEVLARGGVTGVHGGIGSPDGHGWLLDDSELNGLTFPTGTWSTKLSLKTSDVNATGDLYVRWYKLNILGATYTAIGQAVLTGQTITTSLTEFVLSATGVASVTFNSGESLYCDVWWDQTGGGSGSTLMSAAVASTTSGVPGDSGGFEVITPYSAGSVTGQVTFASKAGLKASSQYVGQVTLGSKQGLRVIGIAKSALPTIPPVPMPLVSLNAPAYSNATFYPAGNANDNNYGTQWRSVTVPSGGSPQWLVYDLSGVPTTQRAAMLLEWFNEQGGQYLDSGGAFASSLPTNYTIDANAAAGGTGVAPSSGWVNLITVTGNVYTSVQHLLNLTGYNWLRFQATAALGTSPNNDVNLQMDVHDAHLGAMDRWLFLGDSITNECLLHPALAGGAWGYGGALSQLVSAYSGGLYYPAIIDGGNAGQTMAWAATNIAGLLNGFTGGFVMLAFGTNDCNAAGFDWTAGDSNVQGVYNNLKTCINAALSLNNVVIVPKIPASGPDSPYAGYNGNLVNQYVAAHLPTDYPTQFGNSLFIGPDFWTFFTQNQNLIRTDSGPIQIHPTYIEVSGQPSGYEAMHNLYALWMLQNIYQIALPTPSGVSVALSSSGVPGGVSISVVV